MRKVAGVGTLCRERCGVLTGDSSERVDVGHRAGAQAVRAHLVAGHLAGGVQAGNGGVGVVEDLREHAYEYWFLRAEDDGRIVGYTGGRAEPETNRYFISKVYLQAEERGKGFASQAIAFYERLCHERGLEAMYLTVNKHNDLGIRAYLGKGFETIDAVETDIGNGFVMDDFIMEKRVE